MELFNLILTAVGTVGFPIVMCLILLYYMKENDDKHDAEVKELSSAVQNNTLVMQKLIDHLDMSNQLEDNKK